jgi:hypothetical protein
MVPHHNYSVGSGQRAKGSQESMEREVRGENIYSIRPNKNGE